MPVFLKVTFPHIAPVILLLFSLMAGALNGVVLAADQPRFQNNSFKNQNKNVATVWHQIPFYAGADLGQYQATMAKNRSQVRQELLSELTGSLRMFADRGAPIESMLEPLANIILQFDQMHDLHKARDIANINISLESQFKSSLDQEFIRHDIRDEARKLQISRGTEPELLQYYLRGIASSNPKGSSKSPQALRIQYALEIFNQIDYVAFGTFSHLGNNQFQVTLQLQGHKNGVIRHFMTSGSLANAINTLASQVFDYFQKNEYPDWATPAGKLTWLPMPANPLRNNPFISSTGYTFEEAQNYCNEHGYRLPYTREMLSAEAGGAYKNGGKAHLHHGLHYAVLDKRRLNAHYALHIGEEQRSGGAIQPVGSGADKGAFWCTKGTPSSMVVLHELLWKLHRKHSAGDGSNKPIYAAVTTIRYELGDADTDIVYYHNTQTDNLFDKVKRYDSIDDALEVLKSNGIALDIPGYARPGP